MTRSGSNEWTGGVSTYWTPNSLRSTRGVSYQAGGNNAAGIQNFNQYSESELKDYTAYLGGSSGKTTCSCSVSIMSVMWRHRVRDRVLTRIAQLTLTAWPPVRVLKAMHRTTIRVGL